MSTHPSTTPALSPVRRLADAPSAPPALQFCRADARRLLAVREAVRADLAGRLAPWRRVAYVWHGLKRAPFAFVPFGVAAVNFLGMSRLVSRALGAAGMLQDSGAQRAGLSLAAQAYAQVSHSVAAADCISATARCCGASTLSCRSALLASLLLSHR